MGDGRRKREVVGCLAFVEDISFSATVGNAFRVWGPDSYIRRRSSRQFRWIHGEIEESPSQVHTVNLRGLGVCLKLGFL